MSGSLENNGRIIADGYGSDAHALDLRGFTYQKPNGFEGPAVINTIENETRQADARFDQSVDNGWFAQNHGELLLSAASPVTDDYATCNWGESPLQGSAYDGTYKESVDGIDLVNSVQLTFDSVSAGAATIYLAAPLGATGSFGMLA
jgi:hypothetical protein